eukprot:CAMPEP_0177350258 /NCGR_PEP_ID=MMETSP0368-20130122/31230_1 /TAXON_ID=447022 ORGANISM="Scrippsiella hangoei-like, Strain SHHI-4" /NCGR_SAMPLE_ID=MMETSP0368 /ASSEMBLY_ACC=CAM_ASM_000363 /LENGTH=139 /DNA_ID=CAMNT_0018812179 /DNA_START=48 /DNA_END=467 /DNA_ORIENTATION=+
MAKDPAESGGGGSGVCGEEWVEKVKLSTAEWRKRLTPSEYQILRCHGTEAPGTHSHIRFFPSDGYFACAGCLLPLYSAGAKFRDPGWPAWDKCFFSEAAGCHVATKSGMGGTEILCGRCEGHLGHVFFGERHTKTNERH